MSRRRKIITVLICGVLVITAVLLLRNREPSFEGRSLTQWMAVGEVSFSPVESDEAASAMRQIGTNALPHLLKWIQYEPTGNGRGLIPRINTALAWINDKVSFTGTIIISDPNSFRAFRAPKAFGCLGNLASPAVPELARLLNDAENHWIPADNAGEALARMGKTGLPPLLAALNGTNESVRMVVLINLPYLQTNALPIIPLLIQMLQSDAVVESRAAASVLGNLAIEPDTVVPALITALSSPNRNKVTTAAEALARFGPIARPAIPALTNLFTSGSEEVRTIATNALNTIDPILFTNRGPTIPAVN